MKGGWEIRIGNGRVLWDGVIDEHERSYVGFYSVTPPLYICPFLEFLKALEGFANAEKL